MRIQGDIEKNGKSANIAHCLGQNLTGTNRNMDSAQSDGFEFPTSLSGSISGTVQMGRIFKTTSGNIYEVTGLTLQLVLELQRTISHHIKDAWQWAPTSSRYFFCDDAACDVVYFGDDGSTILNSQLRTRVGSKEVSGDKILCYCFGITEDDFQSNPATKEFVIAQTKAGLCSCDTSNPSGRCCLKDFPKPTS